MDEIHQMRVLAWLQGIHAAKMGMPKAANPYDRRTRPYLRRCWQAGHRAQISAERRGLYS